MRRLGIILAVLALVVAIAYGLRARIATRLMETAAERLLGADPLAELPDGLHLTLCGAGSPLPDPVRSGPCVGIIAGKHLFVVDAGAAAARNMAAMNLPVGQLEAVFLTHLHSDHIDGLGELGLQRWAGGNGSEPLPVYGPEGTDTVASGFNAAYRIDAGYRVAHHGPETVPPSGAGLRARPFRAPPPGSPVVVLEQDGLRVTAFRVDHDPVDPAVGYRFDYGERSIVVSGDTVKSPEIERMAKDVDLLVHEALAAHLVAILTEAAEKLGQTARAKITSDILDYHATPVDAAETAEAAGARHLLFYHIVPPLRVPGMEAAFVEGVADAYSGDFTVGRDGVRVSLPANSTAIQISGD
jgi:ribonuclease Z